MIRKNYLLIACAMLLTLSMAGQTTYFNTYEAPTTGNNGRVSLNLPGGYLLTAGNVPDFTRGDKEILLVKTDTAGSLHWTKTIGTTDDNYFVGMAQGDGGRIAILSYDSIQGQCYHKLMLIDTTGSILFEKTFLLNNGVQLSHQKLLTLTSGNIIVYGTYSNHVLLMNMNIFGILNWTRDLSSTISGVSLTDLDLTEMSNGDLALIVNMEGGTLLTKQFGFLLLNSTANIMSSQRFSTTVDLKGKRIYYSPTTGDLLIGAIADNASALLLRLDSGGLLYWTKSYISTYLNHATLVDMAFDPSSDECMTLSADNTYGLEVNRFNANGDFMWSMAGPYHNEEPKSLAIENSGALIVTGNIQSTVSAFYNFFLTRIMSDGLLCDNSINTTPSFGTYVAVQVNEAFSINPQVTLTDTTIADTSRLYLLVPTEKCQAYVGIVNPEKSFTLHSNIVSTELHLRTLEPYNKSDQIILTDYSGRIITTPPPVYGYYELTLNVSRLHEGYYIISHYKNGVSHRERFLIVR